MTIDKSGNVYATGNLSGSDIPAVSKYDTDGNKIWTWSAPDTEAGSVFFAIAVDQSENVYITGYLSENNGNRPYCYLTVKIDANGAQGWSETYVGPGKSDDIAFDIAVDGQGNVFVTGRSAGIDMGYDYATIKYNNAGNQIWVARYNDPSNGDDEASCLSLDSKGNVYVTGQSSGSDINYDYATIKYDTNGNQLWIARYSGANKSNNLPSALALDSSGNVYVTGMSSPFPGTMTYAPGDYDRTVQDFATVKYDSNGHQLWAEIYDNAQGGSIAAGITVDNGGNVFVTGSSGRCIPITTP